MIKEVPQQPLSDEGGEEATSTLAEDDGGDVGAEREEDGGRTANVSKLNLIWRCEVV